MSLLSQIKSKFKKAVSATEINNEDVIQAAAISSSMRDAIQLWGDMYQNRAPWLHEATIEDPTECRSLNLAATISRIKAEIATVEMTTRIISPPNEKGEEDNIPPRVKFLDNQYQDKVVEKIRTQLEFAIAKGGMAIKPYPIIDKKTGYAEFGIDFIQADGFYPLAFNNAGRITKAAFIQQKVEDKKVYSRVEQHELQGNSTIVTNTAYVKNVSVTSNNQIRSLHDLGTRISLTAVPEWATIQPKQVIRGVDRIMFAYLKMPTANTIDTYSPLGVSGFSRAVGFIRDADEQYSRLLWEFEGGELAIDADRDALSPMQYEDANGRVQTTYVLPKKQMRLMRKTNVDTNAGEMYEVFSPALRDESLNNGLNIILKKIEDAVGLSAGTLSDVNDTVRTATELIINKQTTYITNCDIQRALKNALEDVVYIMDTYCTLYNMVGDIGQSEDGKEDYAEKGEYEFVCEFHDSIITNETEEYQRDLQDYHEGIISRVELRMKRKGETRAQAQAALDLMDKEALEAAQKRMMSESTGEETTVENDMGNEQ